MSLLRRKTLVTAALGAFLLSLAATAGADDAAALRKLFAEPLQAVHHWSDLPPEIRRLVSAPWQGKSIADPGQPFQVSDAVVDPGLPWRRLIKITDDLRRIDDLRGTKGIGKQRVEGQRDEKIETRNASKLPQ